MHDPIVPAMTENVPKDITMTETEKTVLDRANAALRWIYKNGFRHSSECPNSVSEAFNRSFAKERAALSRAPEVEREGAAERLAIVAEKPARLIRWGEGDRLDLQSVLAALSPPSTGGEGGARTYSQAEVDSILKAAFPFQTKSERAAFLSHPSPEMGEWRPEVRAFADLMEAQLRANDHKPGWKDDTDLDLFERLGQESAELLAALRRNAKRLMWGDSWVMEDTVPRVGAEAADVANFAMMIADVCGALKLKENGLSREELGGLARSQPGSDAQERSPVPPLSDGEGQ